jgi:hypothetical protein
MRETSDFHAKLTATAEMTDYPREILQVFVVQMLRVAAPPAPSARKKSKYSCIV